MEGNLLLKGLESLKRAIDLKRITEEEYHNKMSDEIEQMNDNWSKTGPRSK